MGLKAPRLSVEEAFRRVAALASPVGVETVGLTRAAGRVLREDLTALRTQPPFAASAMDGYAVRRAEATEGAKLRIVAEIAAGADLPRSLEAGEAMRIFTGAPTPEGADAIALQEDVDMLEADGARWAVLRAPLGDESYIRPRGGDFSEDDRLLSAPRRLSAEDVALAAAAGRPWLVVARRPRVTLLAMGDELALPGEPLGPSAIVASNGFGVAALLEEAGAAVELAPITRDRPEDMAKALEAARWSDLIVTLGGASEGDHDLAATAFKEAGAALDFHKIAMRPGKPLMAGRLADGPIVLGLPGNPVSAMVCARLFAAPLINGLLGAAMAPPLTRPVVLAEALGANGPRAHYMRAHLTEDGRAIAAANQDSSLLSVLAKADILLMRPAYDAARAAGESLEAIILREDRQAADKRIDTKVEQ